MGLYHATNLLTALGLATHTYVQTQPHKLISGTTATETRCAPACGWYTFGLKTH